MQKKNYILRVCAFGFVINLVLFFVKLYIGLGTNSISIYSDAVNNLFDSLSGGMTFAGLAVVKKSNGAYDGTVRKTEQLFSFIISLTVIVASLYFLYNSLERLIYPTPIWFSTLYAWIIAGTAAVKGLMFAYYRQYEKKTKSPVIGVMKTDCILDMFITLITLVTLIVSKYETYAFDAVCGIAISIIIVAVAIKTIITCAKKLVDYIPTGTEDELKAILASYELEIIEIDYKNDGVRLKAFVTVSGEIDALKNEIQRICREKTDVEVFLLNEV